MECQDDCACSGNTLGRLVQPAIMVLLSHEPLHGYLIVQRLENLPLFHGHPPDPAGVYRQLKALEEAGYLVSTIDLGDGVPAKRVFGLTKSGQACLGQWIATLDDYARSIQDMLGNVKRKKTSKNSRR